MRILFDYGADTNTQNILTKNMLMAVYERGHERIVKLLLDKEVDIDVRSERSSFSAVEIAAIHGHEKIVKMLVAKGAVMPEDGGSEDRSEQERDSSIEHEVLHSGASPTVPDSD